MIWHKFVIDKKYRRCQYCTMFLYKLKAENETLTAGDSMKRIMLTMIIFIVTLAIGSVADPRSDFFSSAIKECSPENANLFYLGYLSLLILLLVVAYIAGLSNRTENKYLARVNAGLMVLSLFLPIIVWKIGDLARMGTIWESMAQDFPAMVCFVFMLSSFMMGMEPESAAFTSLISALFIIIVYTNLTGYYFSCLIFIVLSPIIYLNSLKIRIRKKTGPKSSKN